MAMINIVIFAGSIKRKVVLNFDIFLINLSSCGMQQLSLRAQHGTDDDNCK